MAERNRITNCGDFEQDRVILTMKERQWTMSNSCRFFDPSRKPVGLFGNMVVTPGHRSSRDSEFGLISLDCREEIGR
jgi:hypothetical protein